MDREKVIEAFNDAKELVWTDDDEYTVGYNNGLEAGKNIALSMLKEQEAVKPKAIRMNAFGHPVYACGECGLLITESMIYCHECGKRIDWFSIDGDRKE